MMSNRSGLQMMLQQVAKLMFFGLGGTIWSGLVQSMATMPTLQKCGWLWKIISLQPLKHSMTQAFRSLHRVEVSWGWPGDCFLHWVLCGFSGGEVGQRGWEAGLLGTVPTTCSLCCFHTRACFKVELHVTNNPKYSTLVRSSGAGYPPQTPSSTDWQKCHKWSWIRALLLALLSRGVEHCESIATMLQPVFLPPYCPHHPAEQQLS